MSYRDDRRALRLRNEQLERELEDARRELTELKEGEQDEPVAAQRPLPAPPDREGWSAMPSILLIGLGIGAVLLRAPVTMAAGVLLIALGALSVVVGKLLHVVRPNEALVLSGRRHQRADGSNVGYRIVRARVLRTPLVETAKPMDLTVMTVPVELGSAFCSKGAAVDVAATALVKVSSDPELIHNAVERFLDQPRASMAMAAGQTLEAGLREALATKDLDDIDGARLKLLDEVRDGVRYDFDKLGLELVGFWLLDATDDDGELTATRRKRAAAELRRVHQLSSERRAG